MSEVRRGRAGAEPKCSTWPKCGCGVVGLPPGTCCAGVQQSEHDVAIATLRADLENERAMRAAEHDDTHSRIEKLLTESVELRASNERLRAWLEIAMEDYESHAGLSRLTNHWTNQVKAALAGAAP